jgi:hypothetical protein
MVHEGKARGHKAPTVIRVGSGGGSGGLGVAISMGEKKENSEKH